VPAELWDRGRELLLPFTEWLSTGHALVLLVGRPMDASVDDAIDLGVFGTVADAPSEGELVLAITRGLELLEAKRRAEHHGASVTRYESELGELLGIARAMSTERDVGKLLGIILEKSRLVTGADAASIYVVDTSEDTPRLRFKLTQNASVAFDSREFVIPISNRSIAGSAALERKTINLPDVYDLPVGSPFGFDRSFDAKIGYRTKSMLVAPLVSQRGEVIGVIQLINKKRSPASRLASPEAVEREVVAFDARSEEILGMLAAQAAASLETALLYDEIRRLFEGFVRASVEAIESRDPTTSGHSRRVADLTLELARVVDGADSGPFRAVSFDAEHLREIEYASLLHDFGKIGVRERVLVKAKKLFDEQLELIRARFDFVARTLEADILARKLRAIERGASAGALEALDRELSERRAELDASFAAILSANEPTVLSAGDFERIESIARETYVDLRGGVQALLEPPEVVALSVKRGSLTPEEYDEIRSHVTHTFRFLSQIPWGKSLRAVPIIAGAHHERVNGTGYPSRLHAEAIPIQSKMMAIADIFDALTASDRPYKKAVPLERALDILEYNVKDGHLDGDLVRVFREARVWERDAVKPSI
jgi:HD-GYP domain-containing protein (c-di-GMP phosphodiesterase class II)